jgi:hypothetical protein
MCKKLYPSSQLRDKMDNWAIKVQFGVLLFTVYFIEIEFVLLLKCTSMKIPTNSIVVKN